MKLIRKTLGTLLILGGFIASTNLLPAQETETAIQAEPLSLTPADVQSFSSLSEAQAAALVSALEATPTIPVESGTLGTFYSLQHPEWPPLPADLSGSSVWNFGTFCLLSDLNYSYQAAAGVSLMKPGGMRAMTLDIPSPEDGGDTNGYGTYESSYTPVDYGTNLWLSITNVAGSVADLVLSNTLPDVPYEIQANADIARTNWVFAGWAYGSEETNWTPVSVAATNDPALFYRVRSWADDGSGLPVWWQQQYGVSDPYGDPDGDGWNNLQELHNGTDPTLFNQPPTPAVYASLDKNGLATVSWLTSPGPVTNYFVRKTNGDTGLTSDFNFDPNTTSFEDNLSGESPDFTYTPQLNISYSVEAQYAGGNSAAGVAYVASGSAPSASIVTGTQGRPCYVFRGLPGDLSMIRIYRKQLFGVYAAAWGDYLQFNMIGSLDSYDPLADDYFEISAASITNGIVPLPDLQMPPFLQYNLWVQTVRSNGIASSWYPVPYDVLKAVNMPLADARSQMKDNLRFLLRSATESGPFALEVNDGFFTQVLEQPANHVCSGFYSVAFGGLDFDSLRPFYDNAFYRNFVFDQNNLDADGSLNTGCYYGDDYVGSTKSSDLLVTNYPAYFFNAADYIMAANPATPASWLTASQTTWIVPPADFNDGNVALGDRNFYGLPYLSVKDAYVADGELHLATFNPGDSAPDGICYRQAAQPAFHVDDYYFARPGADPMPEQGSFSPTNATPVLIAGVGQSMPQLAGYARLSVQNGYGGVYAYLGQYFDRAYKITNGGVTADTTGVLSPYGHFFATDPGPTALVTMPDIDTGERGTATVYCVSLQLDANHDGNMDMSFAGPDAVSQYSPFILWVNNNYDRGHTVDGSDFEQDDLGPVDIAKLPAYQQVPDCNYVNASGQPAIPSTRDLEDYFRFWTPGVAAAMAAAPTNYTVQLTLNGDGQIRIFRAYETSGGTNYLFDETTASNQVANSASLYVGLLTSSSPIVLNNRTNEHYIFCGAQTGSAQIHLQVLDGSLNVVANATAYLQINDIKQMYERWTVGEDPKVAPMNVAMNAVEDLPQFASAFQYPLPQDTNTPYILFVHGWNQETWEKDRYAEVVYKRLYWQGYQGRFGSFRWPTDHDFGGIGDSWNNPVTDPRNFDNSEYTAWRSGTGLLNKLNDLNSKYPGNVYVIAHSMGNVVTGEALRLAGTNRVVNTYVAMQGAVAAHAYDPTTTTRALVTVLGISQDSGTPNRYAEYYTNGAPCYFANSAGAGTYVNFFNGNDYALAAFLWQLNENLKPDNGITPAYHYVTPSGTHPSGFYRQSGSIETNLYFPTNTYEIFAYGDEARCYAIGAQTDVGGSFSTNNQVNLSLPPFNFDGTHKCHSGEFRSDNMQRELFWNTVLVRMKLK